MPDQTHEIDPNPYAPSAVAEPYDRREYEGDLPTEVGLWRDGNLIVMHVDAPWPAMCVKTGELAVGLHTVRITRRVPGAGWRYEEIDVRVPLGSRWHWLVTRLRWGLFATGFILVPGTFALLTWQSVGAPLEMIAGALLGTFIVIVIGGSLGDTVVLRRSRGNYLWHSGAGEQFLAQLPPWPAGRSQ